MPATTRPVWRWVLVLAGAIVIGVLALGMWVGICSMPAGSADGSCRSEPVLGWPGAIAVAALCAVAAGWAVVRLVRR